MALRVVPSFHGFKSVSCLYNFLQFFGLQKKALSELFDQNYRIIKMKVN